MVWPVTVAETQTQDHRETWRSATGHMRPLRVCRKRLQYRLAILPRNCLGSTGETNRPHDRVLLITLGTVAYSVLPPQGCSRPWQVALKTMTVRHRLMREPR